MLRRREALARGEGGSDHGRVRKDGRVGDGRCSRVILTCREHSGRVGTGSYALQRRRAGRLATRQDREARGRCQRSKVFFSGGGVALRGRGTKRTVDELGRVAEARARLYRRASQLGKEGLEAFLLLGTILPSGLARRALTSRRGGLRCRVAVIVLGGRGVGEVVAVVPPSDVQSVRRRCLVVRRCVAARSVLAGCLVPLLVHGDAVGSEDNRQ